MDKKEYLSMSHNNKQKIIEKVKKVFFAEKGIIFSYVFGSFLTSPTFRDVDIGVYVDDISKENVFDKELEMTKKISEECGLPSDLIDVKILNFAPDHFLNSVFKNGTILFAKNEKLLSDMIEKTSLNAVANEYFSYQSLKELVPR